MIDFANWFCRTTLCVLLSALCFNAIWSVSAATCPTEITIHPSDWTAQQGFFMQYGFSAALSTTGNRVALLGDGTTQDGDAAYLYEETSAGNWTEVAKLQAADETSLDHVQFGHAVDIDGSTAIIGARYDSEMADKSGAAYIFGESAGVWSEQQKLIAGDATSLQYFGSSVGISLSTALVANNENGGAVYVFVEFSPGVWTQTQKLVPVDIGVGDGFGYSLAMSGTKAIIGARGDNSNTGSAYLVSESSLGTWAEVQKLEAGDFTTWDYFGYAVDLEPSTAVISAVGVDSNTGAVYIMDENSPGGSWSETVKLNPSDGAYSGRFGASVSISGSTIVVGANPVSGDGSAYIFTETTPGMWTESVKLVAPAEGNAFNDKFGSAVVVLGNVVLVTEPEDDLAIFHYLDDVDDCPGNVCEHGSTCVDSIYDYCCECPAEYGGEHCATCICENGGVCAADSITLESYCDCTSANWYGVTCSSKLCNNGVGATYPEEACNCTLSGATGKFCTDDIDDCLSNPCINGGICTDYGADLFPNHNNEFNCSCPDNYFGDTCADTLCYSSPCLNNGTCGNGRDLVCNCTGTGYEGVFCQTEVDECASSPCLNKGVCTDLLGTFSCDCTDTGSTGPICNNDIDDCTSSPCMNHGVCKDKGKNKYQCTCNAYYTGTTCETDIDDCVTNACQNEAICVDGLGNYTCNCTMEGYEGEFCDMDIDDCASSPCEHGGTCYDVLNGFSCDCVPGYEGSGCQDPVLCFDVVCQNGGTCEDGACVCSSSYIGDFCELTINDDTEPIVFELSFASFARDNDTAESFALELPMLLAEATPGTVASDFQVRLLDNDEQISYEVTFQNYQDIEPTIILEAIGDPEAPFVERIDGTVSVTADIAPEEEEEDVSSKEDDMTWLIVLLVILGVALLVGGAFFAKRYHDHHGANVLGKFKGDKLSMPV